MRKQCSRNHLGVKQVDLAIPSIPVRSLSAHTGSEKGEHLTENPFSQGHFHTGPSVLRPTVGSVSAGVAGQICLLPLYSVSPPINRNGYSA